jgi:glycosyltransferase involved in cell wall biosynthesis
VHGARPCWRLELILAAEGELRVGAEALGISTKVLPFPRTLARLGDSGISAVPIPRLAVATARMLTAIPPSIGYVLKLRRTIGNAAPDLIHVNGFKMQLLSAWACPRSVPIIWHIRDYVRSRRVMRKLLRLHALRCAAVIANSSSVAEDARAFCGKARTFALHNMIDVDHFKPVGPVADLDLLSRLSPATADTLKIGMLATMASWKGHDVFLRAFSLLPREQPIRAYVIGGPIYDTEGSQQKIDDLRQLSIRLGIADRVGFTGFVDDPARAIRALDVVVHASTQPEPFGRVVAEAMACQKPVVVSSAGGVMEFVTPDIDALCYPPGNSEALARAIYRLIANRELRVRLARAGRVTAEQRFGLCRLAEALVPIYHQVAYEQILHSAA